MFLVNISSLKRMRDKPGQRRLKGCEMDKIWTKTENSGMTRSLQNKMQRLRCRSLLKFSTCLLEIGRRFPLKIQYIKFWSLFSGFSADIVWISRWFLASIRWISCGHLQSKFCKCPVELSTRYIVDKPRRREAGPRTAVTKEHVNQASCYEG